MGIAASFSTPNLARARVRWDSMRWYSEETQEFFRDERFGLAPYQMEDHVSRGCVMLEEGSFATRGPKARFYDATLR